MSGSSLGPVHARQVRTVPPSNFPKAHKIFSLEEGEGERERNKKRLNDLIRDYSNF